MEIKKSKEANLENKRLVFGLVGLVMVASMVLMAFQYKSANEYELVANDDDDNGLGDEMVFELPPEEEIIEEEPDQTPPPPEIPDVEIVDDEEEIDEQDFSDIGEEQEIFEDEEEGIVEEAIVDFAEVEPEFPGGEVAMAEFIQKNFEYPSISVEMGEQGIVYVNFVVNSNGSIEQVKVLRGVSDALDAEAVRIVKKMPKWKAGEQAGKRVRVRFTMPIKCNLG